MKNKILWVVIGWVLVAGVVWTVSAYSTNIWGPIQFVKQLFVTPNGELDSSKATIKIDGTNGTIEAKNVKVNWEDVATKSYVDNKLKNIDTSNLTVKNLKTTNGKYLIKDGKIQWVSLIKTIVDYAGWRRWSDGTYAGSCNEYRHPQAGYKYAWSIWNGIYWIKPNGVSSAFKVYCDMTTDGGGWTRYASIKNKYRISDVKQCILNDKIVDNSKVFCFNPYKYLGIKEWVSKIMIVRQSDWRREIWPIKRYRDTNGRISIKKRDIFDCMYDNAYWSYSNPSYCRLGYNYASNNYDWQPGWVTRVHINVYWTRFMNWVRHSSSRKNWTVDMDRQNSVIKYDFYVK